MYSGCITEWHVVPQNLLESRYSTPFDVAVASTATLIAVSAAMMAVARTIRGLRKSTVGGVTGCPSAFCRRRCQSTPIGISSRPTTNRTGRMRKRTMPE